MNREDLLIRPEQVLRLAKLSSDATFGFESKSKAHKKLGSDIDRLAELQDVFAAAQSHALLIVLQGMDTAGKDSAIKHVMSGVNPQGVDVHSFKTPSAVEDRHDFLWRCEKALPERGRIGIFNRSYYEEVLVVRVHRDIFAQETHGTNHDPWSERFEDINAFERHLVRNGTIVLKFFLHVSKDEQRKRLLERLDDPNKNWKFAESDLTERRYWDRYESAYEKALSATSTTWAPWYVIPADHKWFVRVALADVVVATLEALNLQYPRVEGASATLLQQCRAQLESEST
jgi:PPK2 family polyphosphate:nucleotide phosphotransferase